MATWVVVAIVAALIAGPFLVSRRGRGGRGASSSGTWSDSAAASGLVVASDSRDEDCRDHGVRDAGERDCDSRDDNSDAPDSGSCDSGGDSGGGDGGGGGD